MGESIKEVLAEAAARLAASGVKESRLEAGSLMAFTLRRDRTFIISHDDEVLAPDQIADFESCHRYSRDQSR